MPIVFAAIAPHGFPIIPDLSDDAEGGMATRNAMEELGRRAAATKPDVIVLAGPHGTRVEGAICLANVARAAGTLFWQDRQVEMNLAVDGPMTDAIAEAAGKRGVPIALAGYAGNRRDQSAIPLDWGGMTPLWFLGHNRNLVGKGHVLAEPPKEELGPPAVIITPSRDLPRTTMVTFGQAIADAAAASGRRVAFVASCDWGHRHREDGPYGYHPASAEVDALVVQAVADGDPGRLIDLEESRVADAAIDGLWQTLMLAGVMKEVPLDGEVLCYEAPRYYGMLVASFTPRAGS